MPQPMTELGPRSVSGGVDESAVNEGTDAPDGTGTPYSISPGDTFRGELGAVGDRDWVAIDLDAGDSYTIAIQGQPSSVGSLYDPYLRVYDANGDLVTSNDDGGTGYESELTFSPNTAGTYYVSAGSYQWDDPDLRQGTYEISVTESSGPAEADLDTLADYLSDGYWQDSGRSARAFDTSTDNQITVDVGALTAEGQQLARWAFEAWEMVADLEFEEVNGSADITFDDDDSGAYSGSFVLGDEITSSEVNVSTNWLDRSGTTIDSYSFQTYVHEIGHAIGLGHPGDYNGSGVTYDDDTTFTNDSWQMSIMSYWNQQENPTTNADYALLATTMMADILAIQNIYGAPDQNSATAGATTYGANSNLGNYLGQFFDMLASGTTDPDIYTGEVMALTIADVGGTDTIDLSFTDVANRLDLRQQAFSDIAGLDGNLGIARGTVIENAIGGSADDEVIGNNVSNQLSGGAGDDTLTGGAGNDTLEGGTGNDLLNGGTGSDSLDGGTGNDELIGWAGNDVVFGADGQDTLIGHGGNDTLLGQSDDDVLAGWAGNDQINGGTGSDTIYGGTGNDRLVGWSGNDLIFGADGQDTLIGHGGNDALFGQGDDDVLAGWAGNDQINGGTGSDTIYGGTGNDGLVGWAGNDKVYGGDGQDTIFGHGGNDTLLGQNGDDVLAGWAGDDQIRGGAGNDLLAGGTQSDDFIFVDGFGQDTIVDFDANDGFEEIDLTAVSSITNFTDLMNNHVSQAGSHVLIEALDGSGDFIRVNGVTLADLDQTDFIL